MKEFCQLENIIKMGSTYRRGWRNPCGIGFNSLLIRKLAESGGGERLEAGHRGYCLLLLGTLEWG